MSMTHRPTICIGIMSGTSLDGADAVACAFEENKIRFLAHECMGFTSQLRQTLTSLLTPGNNELQRMGEAGILLAHVYADITQKLLDKLQLTASEIDSIGVHGQTIRHCPQDHFTVQLNNPSLLAELTGIDIIADFRSRDMAAGGEGAPLVPAFHQAIFGSHEPRAIVNIGGIANVSFLTPESVTGFDCGPGNTLLDNWCTQQTGHTFDKDGAWGATGQIDDALLQALMADPYFSRKPPKSTGREYFHLNWLKDRFPNIECLAPQDVQRTLAKLTAYGISSAIKNNDHCIKEVFICGGGAFNPLILEDLRSEGLQVHTTQDLGVHPMHVESMAFAWLAYCFRQRKAGNLPAVTHAAGPRILGALYPAF